jgi:hypothetical protein
MNICYTNNDTTLTRRDKIIALWLCIFLAPTGFHRYFLKNYHGLWFFSLFEYSIVFLWLGNYEVKHLALVTSFLFVFLYFRDIFLISTNRLKANYDFPKIVGFILFIPSSVLIYLVCLLITQFYNY